jgi:hypothetical protein
MRMKIKFVILFLGLQLSSLTAQQVVELTISPTFNGEPITLEVAYKFNQGKDSITFSTLKFYISNLEFYYKNQLVHKENEGAHLIDLENENSKNLKIDVGKINLFDEVKFDLGIDSSTNVSGAFGGDLDPTKGMYWTWQSGYINVKLEGHSNLCNNRLKEFQLHLGGYANEVNALQAIMLKVPQTNTINIDIDLFAYVKSFDLTGNNMVMSPSSNAVILSSKLAQCFKVAER